MYKLTVSLDQNTAVDADGARFEFDAARGISCRVCGLSDTTPAGDSRLRCRMDGRLDQALCDPHSRRDRHLGVWRLVKRGKNRL